MKTARVRWNSDGALRKGLNVNSVTCAIPQVTWLVAVAGHGISPVTIRGEERLAMDVSMDQASGSRHAPWQARPQRERLWLGNGGKALWASQNWLTDYVPLQEFLQGHNRV
jgi:hypothetical protein